MNNSERRWFGLTYQERDALLHRDDTRDFLQRVRALRSQQNSANGAELGIPTEFMSILRDLTYQNSKLWPYVHSEFVRGHARQNIVGTGAEAVWSEMLGNVNEITLDFTQLEIEGYMLSGYMAISNAYLQDDADLQLLTSILNAMEPVMAQCCFESVDLLINGFDTLRTRCVDGIIANEDRCREEVHHSIGVVTALNPVIGYKNSTKIAKEALETGVSVYQLVLDHGILTKEELDTILSPENMIKPVKLDIKPRR